MLRYHTLPGVVLTCVCGEYMLVSAKSVRDKVPYMVQLNESSAFLWKRLSEGADEPELEKAVMDEFEIEDIVQARSAIKGFLEQMLQNGLLLKEGE